MRSLALVAADQLSTPQLVEAFNHTFEGRGTKPHLYTLLHIYTVWLFLQPPGYRPICWPRLPHKSVI
jgi:hypothetical protein